MSWSRLLAIALAAALLILSLTRSSPPPPPADHAQICALLGAVMADSDTTTGLPARAARLYQEDHCR